MFVWKTKINKKRPGKTDFYIKVLICEMKIVFDCVSIHFLGRWVLFLFFLSESKWSTLFEVSKYSAFEAAACHTVMDPLSRGRDEQPDLPK